MIEWANKFPNRKTVLLYLSQSTTFCIWTAWTHHSVINKYNNKQEKKRERKIELNGILTIHKCPNKTSEFTEERKKTETETNELSRWNLNLWTLHNLVYYMNNKNYWVFCFLKKNTQTKNAFGRNDEKKKTVQMKRIMVLITIICTTRPTEKRTEKPSHEQTDWHPTLTSCFMAFFNFHI